MRARLPLTHPQGRQAGYERRGRHGRAGHSSARLDAVSSGYLGMTAVLAGRAFCDFPVFSYRGGRCGPAVTGGVQPMPLAAGLPIRLRAGRSQWPSSACGAARPGPARRTLYTAFGASTAIASTVSRRGWRRRHGTPMTIHATGETRPYQRKNRDSRRAAGVSVPAGAGASAASLRNRSLRCPSNPARAAMFSSTSAPVGASVPRPHATSPKPAAPAHSASARCRRPAAQCPAPAAAWVTTGATGDTHPRVLCRSNIRLDG